MLLLVFGIIFSGVGAGIWYANGEKVEYRGLAELKEPANTGAQAFGIGMGIIGLGMTTTGLIILSGNPKSNKTKNNKGKTSKQNVRKTETELPICDECGAEVQDNDKFCSKCGVEFE